MSDEYQFLPENMFKVMDEMKHTSKFLSKIETQELCDTYAGLFPSEDGLYSMSYTHMTALCNLMLNDTLLKLYKKDLVEAMWNDETNEFTYKLTEEGKCVASMIEEKE